MPRGTSVEAIAVVTAVDLVLYSQHNPPDSGESRCGRLVRTLELRIGIRKSSLILKPDLSIYPRYAEATAHFVARDHRTSEQLGLHSEADRS